MLLILFHVSIPFTELHKYVYTVLLLMWLLFTNKLWKFVKGFLHSIALQNFVSVSLSISELYEDASSHCSLLWYEKEFVYQQIITTLVISHESLSLYQVSGMYTLWLVSYKNMHVLL